MNPSSSSSTYSPSWVKLFWQNTDTSNYFSPSEAISPTQTQPPIQEPKEKIILKIKKRDVFVDSIVSWYIKLSAKEKSKLTARKLKLKAKNLAITLRLSYDNLPIDWVANLEENYGLILKEDKKLKRRRERLKRHLFDIETAFSSTQHSQSATVTPESSGTSLNGEVSHLSNCYTKNLRSFGKRATSNSI